MRSGATVLIVCSAIVGSVAFVLAAAPSQFPERANRVGVGFYVTATDLDDDGRTDLVVPSDSNGDVFVLLGRADGSFDSLSPNSSLPGNRNPAIADFDGDGTLDLAVPNSDYGVLNVWSGNHDGTFVGPTAYSTVNPWVVAIGAGDFDEDGAIDLVLPCFSSCAADDFAFVRGDGAGGFTLSYLTGPSASVLTVADFNEDGHLDVAQSDGGLDIGAGDGTGGFSFSSVSVPSGNDAASIDAADLNGDGHVDVVIGQNQSNRTDASVVVALGNGDGTFATAVSYTVGTTRAAAALGDLDGDGVLDLAVSSEGTAYFSVLRGLGDGTFGAELRHPTALDSRAILVGDFDRDSHRDVAVLNLLSGLTIYHGNGDLTFSPSPDLEPVGSQPSIVVVADLDADGVEDLIAANEGSSDLSVLLGQVDGTFDPEIRSNAGPSIAGDEIPSLVTGQFDSGTTQDVVLVLTDTDELVSLAGAGDGTLSFVAAATVGSAPVDLAVGDFNEDSRLDVVIAHASSDDLWIRRGGGNLQFGPWTTVDLAQPPSAVAVARLDGDTHDDLVAIGGSSTSELFVVLGTGTPAFQSPETYPAGSSATGLAVADFDLDTIPDVAVASRSGVLLFRGVGDGTLQTPLAFPDPDSWINPTLTTDDFNRDGIPDLAVAFIGRFDLLLGVGDGTFVDGGAYSALGQVSASGDWNDDSWRDLALVDRDGAVQIVTNSGPPTIEFEFPADKQTLSWTAVGGATRYNLYRGSLPMLDVDDDDLPDGGYGTCLSVGDLDVTDTTDSDPSLPASGEGWHYLVSFADQFGESSLGRTSGGTQRTVTVSCP